MRKLLNHDVDDVGQFLLRCSRLLRHVHHPIAIIDFERPDAHESTDCPEMLRPAAGLIVTLAFGLARRPRADTCADMFDDWTWRFRQQHECAQPLQDLQLDPHYQSLRSLSVGLGY